jgi:hypothetical protein
MEMERLWFSAAHYLILFFTDFLKFSGTSGFQTNEHPVCRLPPPPSPDEHHAASKRHTGNYEDNTGPVSVTHPILEVVQCTTTQNHHQRSIGLIFLARAATSGAFTCTIKLDNTLALLGHKSEGAELRLRFYEPVFSPHSMLLLFLLHRTRFPVTASARHRVQLKRPLPLGKSASSR